MLLAAAACFVLCAPLSAEDAPAAPTPGAVAERFGELRNLYRDDPARAAEGFRGFLADYGASEWADDARFWLAMSLDKSGAPRRDTLEAYQALLEKHPDSDYCEDALFAIAEVWQNRARRPEDFNQAVKEYARFIKERPQGRRVSEAKLRIGEICFRMNHYEKAETFFRRAADEHPDSPFAALARLQLAGTILKLQRPDEALALYSRLLETDLTDKQHIAAQLGMVDCYLSGRGGLEKALKACEEIRREAVQKKCLEDYTDYKTREKMASYYLEKKDYAEAESEYQAYIAGFGESVGVWQAKLNIGLIRLAAGKPAEAKEMFEAITSKHVVGAWKLPAYAREAMYYRAYAYELEKNFPEARRLYQELAEADGRTYFGRKAAARIEALKLESDKPPQTPRRP